ncbi:hypothetical protein J3Q09_17490 [Pseudomonas sp. R4-83]|uniref:glycine-rich domain-containing protein n=1 Tax=unclassified Pseudomonas TaxID=196821 RepID=UPI003DA7CBAF
MDYPISVPSIGLVGGKFVDENPLTGTPGSLIPSQWGNAVTDEILNVITAAGLTPAELNNTQLVEAIRKLATGRLINVRVFATAGTFTYTPSAGTARIIAECCGAGGAGAGAPATTAGNGSLGSAGGAGAYAQSFITSGFAGVSIVVGAGGTGVSGAAGNPGGSSSFGGFVSCPGGKGGNTSGPSPGSFVALAGNSNGPSGGNIRNFVGQGSDLSICFGPTSLQPGRGGASLFGAGAAPGVAGVAGVAAASPGSGGGGTGNTASSSALTGGAGAPGIVVVWEYA